MDGHPGIQISAIGMLTPLGADTATTANAVNAGVSAQQYTDFFDEDDQPIRMCVVPNDILDNSLNESLLVSTPGDRAARLLQLATVGLKQLTPQLDDSESLPLFLAGPEYCHDLPFSLEKSFIEDLAIQCQIDLDLAASRIFSSGRAGGLDAIALAARFLSDRPDARAIVGAVDSFYIKDVLDCYLAHKRLVTDASLDGFIPGEGACFLLLENSKAAIPDTPLPIIFEPGSSLEQGHLFNDLPHTGEALSRAASIALANARTDRVNTLYSSINGESYFAKELGIMSIRNRDKLSEQVEIRHPADSYGDLGAASALTMVGLAAIDAQNSWSTAPWLIYGSSDGASKAAVVVDTLNQD
jgi:3-oxoacyl-[acyl-carrier-protein] synthase-1